MVDSRLSSTRWSSGHSRELASCRRSLSCATSRSPRYSVGGIPSRSADAPSHATTPASWVKSACLSAGAAELEAAPPLVPSPLPIHCLMSPCCDPTLAFGPRIGGASSRNTDGAAVQATRSAARARKCLAPSRACVVEKFKSQVVAFYPICSSALVGSLPLRSAIRVFRRGPKHTHMDMSMGTYVYSTGPGRVLKPHNRTSRYVRACDIAY